MSRLSLYLLGPPRIERDGVPISIHRRKAVALLAYLPLRKGMDLLMNRVAALERSWLGLRDDEVVEGADR